MRKGKIKAIIFIIVFLLVMATAITLLLDMEKEKQEVQSLGYDPYKVTPVPTIAPTVTPMPVSTIMPTPVPPTPAPTPTPTPRPTATPAPTPTPVPTPVPAPSVSTKAGDTVSFGKYEQNNVIGDGAENIEWLVLDVKDGKALLISRYVLDVKPYNTELIRITWEKCTLRSWLNGEFFLSAFNENEQKLVSRTLVTAEANPDRDTYTGFDTKDKVFMLSVNEVLTYFGDKTGDGCTVTAYTEAGGARVAPGYGVNRSDSCDWWLRTPGHDSTAASVVNFHGECVTYGDDVNRTYVGVRPVVWVYLDPDDPRVLADPVPPDEPSPVNIGDHITFGKYEQDNDESNGKENIEWVVLDVHDGKALVQSLYSLDTQPYNTTLKDVTWETCTLRSWLNSEFLQNAFDENERERINLTAVTADKPYRHSTSPGNPTNDFVFLLSSEETLRYFPYSNQLSCTSTAYARGRGSSANPSYWMRSPGLRSNEASIISYGDIMSSGVENNRGIRPAMWIDIVP